MDKPLIVKKDQIFGDRKDSAMAISEPSGLRESPCLGFFAGRRRDRCYRDHGADSVGPCPPREGLGHLLCRPFPGGMGGDIEMNHAAPMMGQNDRDKEDSKVRRRHHEEIRRDQLLQVAVEERTPRFGRVVCGDAPYTWQRCLR